MCDRLNAGANNKVLNEVNDDTFRFLLAEHTFVCYEVLVGDTGERSDLSFDAIYDLVRRVFGASSCFKAAN